jgi:hypothetical protein
MMAQPILTIPFKLRLSGKDAEQHQVASYLGTRTLHGFSRSIQIVTQAYLNEEAVSRATALHDANLYLTGAKPGSLTFDFRMDIFRKKAGVTLNRDTFYDFCSTVFSRASGKSHNPTTPHVLRLDEDQESDLIDLTVEQVEESLKVAHSAIDKSVEGIAFNRPRSGTQTYFDHETKQYIESSLKSDLDRKYKGHVTRFNSITGNGRAYINSLKRVVPFKLEEEFLESKRGFLTWSLHGSNVHCAKNLNMNALEITSAAGTVKRLALVDCNQVGDD